MNKTHDWYSNYIYSRKKFSSDKKLLNIKSLSSTQYETYNKMTEYLQVKMKSQSTNHKNYSASDIAIVDMEREKP